MGRYGHALKRNNGDVLRRALDSEAARRRGTVRPNMTWKRQMQEHTDQSGLKKEDAIHRVKGYNGVYVLSRNTRFACGYPSYFSGWRYGMNGNSDSCRQPN